MRLCVCLGAFLCVFWNVPGLIGRLRNAEYYLSPGEAGLECGPILLSAVACRFTLHTSPGRLHFQFRAQFYSFTRTCVLTAGVEASLHVPPCACACSEKYKNLHFPFNWCSSQYFMHEVVCVFPLKWDMPDSLSFHSSLLKSTQISCNLIFFCHRNL